MMNAFKKAACSLAVLVTSAAVMAESIDVKVIGTITPTACKPTLTGGGTIDYGTISPASLKKDAFNQLDKKQLEFAITCDAPAKVAITAINGRPNTAAGTTETGNFSGEAPEGVNTEVDKYVIGLGLDGNKKIGGFTFSISDAQADGKAVDGIQQWEQWGGNTVDWINQGNNYGPLTSSASRITWANKGTTNPIAFTTLAGKLNVQAYINKASELDLTKPVKLDGLSTLELIYL